MNPIDHISVLLKESISYLAIGSGEVVVDATFGRGGHSKAFLETVGPSGMVIAFDVDPDAALAAQRLESNNNFQFIRRNFRELGVAMAKNGIPAVDKIFFDLGVSSPQFDQGERGFSYRFDAALDMRMDPSAGLSATGLLNEWSQAELARMLWEYGEERWAKRIAQFIVAARAEQTIETTGQLVDIVRAAIPKAVREKEDQHPARRTFQALRIAVNDELAALSSGLEQAVALLKPGGRLGCVSFHSLEDRLVKQFIAERTRECTCPKGLPICVCGHKPTLKSITRKPVSPTSEEVSLNPRSRSAHLRVAEKLAQFY